MYTRAPTYKRKYPPVVFTKMIDFYFGGVVRVQKN